MFVIFSYCNFMCTFKFPSINISYIKLIINNQINSHCNAGKFSCFIFIFLHSAFIISRNAIRCQGHNMIKLNSIIVGNCWNNHSRATISP